MRSMKQLTYISFLSLLLLFVSTGALAGTYLPIDSKFYNDFRFLEAEGVITTSQLATLPISRREGARLTNEALKNSATDRSTRVEAVLGRLQREFKRELDDDSFYFRPADTADVHYVYSDRESFFAQKNRDGVEVRRGSNVLVDLTSRFESRYLGVVVKPEIDLHDDATHFTFKKAYLLANLGREEFMFGKESAWWGPGQNGSTLLSTNAEPLTTLKLSNSVPYFPFGIGVRGTIFISRLENDRSDVRKPILNGIRMDIKPAAFIEIGLSKTAMFGGEGRKEDSGTFAHSLFVIGENGSSEDEPGDQRAGFDAKVVLPWHWQPVTLYIDFAGEDQRNHFPEKWFYLYGIYLPRVLNLDGFEIMAEYANNKDSFYKGAWYTHHIYSQGYTYNGRIIGHYMGSDAKDLFLQARYNFEAAVLTLSYEELRKLFPARYTWENYQVTALAELSNSTDLTFSASYARETDSNVLLEIGIRHRF